VFVQTIDGERFEMKVPRTVDDEVWDAANRTINARRKKHGRPGSRVTGLCRGRIRCGKCGRTAYLRVSKKKRCYYYCSGYRTDARGTMCRSGYHDRDKVDEAVWNAVREVIEHPDLLAEASTERQEMDKSWRDQIDQCDRVLERAKREERQVLDLLRQELLSYDLAKERLEGIRSTRQTAEESRRTAERALSRQAAAMAPPASLEHWQTKIQMASTRCQ